MLDLCHFSRSGLGTPFGFCSFSTGCFQGSSVCLNVLLSVLWRGSSVGFSRLMVGSKCCLLTFTFGEINPTSSAWFLAVGDGWSGSYLHDFPFSAQVDLSRSTGKDAFPEP